MQLYIFDLDGTLIDSRLDLAASANATREFMGLPPIAHEVVASYVGNGAPVLVRRLLGDEASDTDVTTALDYFIRHYAEHCMDATFLYPGVRDALDALQAREARLAVLTNKPVRISTHILEGFGISEYFFRVYGGNSFDRKKPDPVGVHALLAETGVPAGEAVMVGDSAVDVQTARNAGVTACGVTYGFQPETFEAHPPDILVDDLRRLCG